MWEEQWLLNPYRQAESQIIAALLAAFPSSDYGSAFEIRAQSVKVAPATGTLRECQLNEPLVSGVRDRPNIAIETPLDANRHCCEIASKGTREQPHLHLQRSKRRTCQASRDQLRRFEA